MELDPEARRAIDDHVRLLLAWTSAINLTAIRDPGAVARLHVIDSLSALPLLREQRVERLVDIGSGGGFPGIPLAAALPARALLVESIAKKARFLETVVAAGTLSGHVSVARTRAEALGRDPRHAHRWQAVTARAVAALGRLIELAMPLLEPGGVLVAWKRGDIDDELADARRVAARFGTRSPTVVDVAAEGLEGHRLVVVRRSGPTRPVRRRPAG